MFGCAASLQKRASCEGLTKARPSGRLCPRATDDRDPAQAARRSCGTNLDVSSRSHVPSRRGRRRSLYRRSDCSGFPRAISSRCRPTLTAPAARPMLDPLHIVPADDHSSSSPSHALFATALLGPIVIGARGWGPPTDEQGGAESATAPRNSAGCPIVLAAVSRLRRRTVR